MRLFTISDLHIDFQENMRWLRDLSNEDYKNDVLIFAGDLTHLNDLLEEGFKLLKKKFSGVLFLPGNHEYWVLNHPVRDSMGKIAAVYRIASDMGIITGPAYYDKISIIPLLGWYDYSFGQPSPDLLNHWTDYRACVWSPGITEEELTRRLLSLNRPYLDIKNQTVITFSHFLPRLDIMPSIVPVAKRITWPVLGTDLLLRQIESIKPQIHIYGHSHINRQIVKDRVLYINNAFGYPYETNISRKQLLCIYDGEEEKWLKS